MVNVTSNLFLLFLLMSSLSIANYGQMDAVSDVKINCVSLQMIKQRPAPKIKEEPAPDVIVMTPDDIHVQFELKNTCDQVIYYLAYKIPESKNTPAGFLLYRDKKNNWKSRSPAWRREGSLTDPFLYDWVPIKKGKSIKFEYSDLSSIEGERSLAIYVNSCKKQNKRVELIAPPFKGVKISEGDFD